MDSFVETYHLPRLNHEEIESMNRPISNEKIESIIKNLSKKNIRPDGSTGEFYQTFEEELNQSSSNSKKLKRRDHLQTHSEVSISQMLKPEKDKTRSRTTDQYSL